MTTRPRRILPSSTLSSAEPAAANSESPFAFRTPPCSFFSSSSSAGHTVYYSGYCPSWLIICSPLLPNGTKLRVRVQYNGVAPKCLKPNPSGATLSVRRLVSSAAIPPILIGAFFSGTSLDDATSGGCFSVRNPWPRKAPQTIQLGIITWTVHLLD